jgi:hypothetical protein
MLCEEFIHRANEIPVGISLERYLMGRRHAPQVNFSGLLMNWFSGMSLSAI